MKFWSKSRQILLRIIIFTEIGECVLAYWLTYQGRSVATTSTCTTKLERFDEITTRGKNYFESEFLETVFQLFEEIIVY